MKQTLVTGLEIKLERTHDLSAVIHAERLSDGRMMITTMPLLYGSYTQTRGPGTFRLEPPLDLNLEAGWPLFKETTRRNAETQYASYRERVSPNRQNEAAAGIAPTPPPPAANELIRVEPARSGNSPGRGRHSSAGAGSAAAHPGETNQGRQKEKGERPLRRRPALARRSWSHKLRRLRWLRPWRRQNHPRRRRSPRPRLPWWPPLSPAAPPAAASPTPTVPPEDSLASTAGRRQLENISAQERCRWAG